MNRERNSETINCEPKEEEEQEQEDDGDLQTKVPNTPHATSSHMPDLHGQVQTQSHRTNTKRTHSVGGFVSS